MAPGEEITRTGRNAAVGFRVTSCGNISGSSCVAAVRLVWHPARNSLDWAEQRPLKFRFELRCSCASPSSEELARLGRVAAIEVRVTPGTRRSEPCDGRESRVTFSDALVV